MTPGQLGLLMRQHNRVHAETDVPSEPAARPGTAVDLARFASMPLT